jgi:hypothetical protein
MFMPFTVTLHLLFRIEPASFDQTFCQAERHRSIIGPFARFEIEWAAADHVDNRCKGTGRTEFHGRSERVTDC